MRIVNQTTLQQHKHRRYICLFLTYLSHLVTFDKWTLLTVFTCAVFVLLFHSGGQSVKAKTITQLTLTESTGNLITVAQTCTTDFNPNYRCRPLHTTFNEWKHTPTDIEDCSRREIAKAYRLGRGY